VQRKLMMNRPRLNFRLRNLILPVCLVPLCALIASTQTRQTSSDLPVDPGPRTGPANSGGPLKGLSDSDEKLFWASWEKFKRLYSVSGTIETGAGLGPSFNGNSCAQCHAQPAAGGSSPSPHSPQVRQIVMRNQHPVLEPEYNPQVALASLDRIIGKSQVVPPFISPDGPVLVPHLVRTPDGQPDGSTHQIYTIAGRVDAPGCELPQTNFAEEMAKHNVVFRIPSPTFGAGLIEGISDSELISNLDSTKAQREAFGIKGRFNRSSNDNTISRFGWKAQNKSLLIFSAESYNVEMGVTSEAFPNKRDQSPACVFNSLPEDRTRVELPITEKYQPSGFASDVVNFAAFMRFSAPPAPVTHTNSELNGQKLFSTVGCSLCHSQALQTGRSTFRGMSQVSIQPYSDFALHQMGPGLADGVTQGLATGSEFRTAPLWGLGQRMFFLHDGRATDLLTAIKAHSSKGTSCQGRQAASHPSASSTACTSEADLVIENFDSLTNTQKQDMLNFLRSL